MKIDLYAVKDTLVGFMQPFCAQSESVAIRMFAASAKAEKPNAVNTFPENKELYKLGEFDDATGAITSDVVFIARAMDYYIPPVSSTVQQNKEAINGNHDK